MNEITNLSGQALGYIEKYGFPVLKAILIWIIGSWIIKKIMGVVKNIMAKKDYDPTLESFISNLIGTILKVLLIITILGTLGVQTTSFAAIIAAAGLAIGMALQGSLGNFAGGVMIMLFKPFKIGDLIEGQGVTGVVKEIQLFVTKLTTPDGKLAIIPNGTLSNGNIINYSGEDNLRVDLNVGIGYGDDIKKAKEVIMETLLADPKVLKTPAPTVAVSELGDNAVNLVVRPHTTVGDYWDVYFNSLENVKVALDKAGISIPYPQQDVHMHTVN